DYCCRRPTCIPIC
uniref:Alpha-conotoxin BruIB n=1 Tax=Conus brunneus TaxID=101289 RepID=CA1B_CONBR|nr:RecName: Full=Alpha-conotoxin BruIB [Conus brunneus]